MPYQALTNFNLYDASNVGVHTVKYFRYINFSIGECFIVITKNQLPTWNYFYDFTTKIKKYIILRNRGWFFSGNHDSRSNVKSPFRHYFAHIWSSYNKKVKLTVLAILSQVDGQPYKRRIIITITILS